MTAITFDTLEFDKKLLQAGFTDQQAETLTHELAKIINEKTVTKNYLDNKFNELDHKFAGKLNELDSKFTAKFAEVDAKFAEVDARVDVRLANLKAELIKWGLGIAGTQAGIIIAFISMVKFLH